MPPRFLEFIKIKCLDEKSVAELHLVLHRGAKDDFERIVNKGTIQVAQKYRLLPPF